MMLRRTGWVLVLLGAHAQIAANPTLEDCRQLSASEIKNAFSDVLDTAAVQQRSGGHATNHWYANGTMTSRWQTADAQGELNGTWWITENDRRCVAIAQPLPDGGPAERCGPIYRCGEDYVTVNADGSIHGRHKLTPLADKPANDY